LENREEDVDGGQFLIVDKPYKNMLNPRNGRTSSEEKGVLGQMSMESHEQAVEKRPSAA
jgi:hypothetical protein